MVSTSTKSPVNSLTLGHLRNLCDRYVPLASRREGSLFRASAVSYQEASPPSPPTQR